MLYVHYIDLLIWSQIKLDFHFMIYYDFFKYSAKIIIIKRQTYL